MLYIKIGDDKYEAQIQTFTTQGGQEAIRVYSDAPIVEGFLVVDGENNIVSDRSEYINVYRETENYVEYTKSAEDMIPTESYFNGSPDSAIDRLARQISYVNNKVNQITPYTETKQAYYKETEKVFYDVPVGNTSVFFDNYNGTYAINRVENRLIVSFNELEQATNVTISIQ